MDHTPKYEFWTVKVGGNMGANLDDLGYDNDFQIQHQPQDSRKKCYQLSFIKIKNFGLLAKMEA